ncbi:MAG: GINS complex subunit [Bathelium mastoideum]|nr:MAG: GINS complex subunit [Bathelium mastoideum]
MADIADILASVAPSPADPSTTDLQSLTRAYIAERCAPELLPYPTALLDRTLARLRTQISTIEDALAAPPPLPNTHPTTTTGAKASFTLVVLQTELERWKWLIRGLLRARLAKIDRHPLHVARAHADRLAPAERSYLEAHQALLERHYSASFMAAFPPALRRLDDVAGGISMVDEPDGERAVFVRALREVGRVGREGGGGGEEEEGGGVVMKKGDVWVVRWSSVRELVGRGEVELV